MTSASTNRPIPATELDSAQRQRATAALVGAAVGDALGAPFEFGPRGAYFGRFPTPVLVGTAEMIGGGEFEWGPGEFTDDTQMAIALALSLIDNDLELNQADLFERFAIWARAALDVGTTTSAALSHPDWRNAAAHAHQTLRGRTGSNGGVMRVAPVAVTGVVKGALWTMTTAYQQTALTHFDPTAGIAAALAAAITRHAIVTGELPDDPEALVLAVGEALVLAPALLRPYLQAVAPGFDPHQTPFGANGGALQCFAEALWAVRTTSSFDDAVRTAIDAGGDTDTVAAVAGAMAGAVYGQQRLPIRWTSHVHGQLQTADGVRTFNCWELLDIAHRLLGLSEPHRTTPEPAITPLKVHPAGVWASNLDGALAAPDGAAIISLCITDRRFSDNPHRREVVLRDSNGENPHIGHVVRQAVEAIEANLAEGREVLVHCHGGRSRTGLILKAWYMKHHRATHADAHEWLQTEWEHYVDWTSDFWTFLDDEWSVSLGLVPNKPNPNKESN